MSIRNWQLGLLVDNQVNFATTKVTIIPLILPIRVLQPPAFRKYSIFFAIPIFTC